MSKKRRDSWQERERKQKLAKEAKAKELNALVVGLDRAIKNALKSDSAYHSGEVQELNEARFSVMTVLSGNAKRR